MFSALTTTMFIATAIRSLNKLCFLRSCDCDKILNSVIIFIEVLGYGYIYTPEYIRKVNARCDRIDLRNG